ncbi:MAG: aminotransferase class III-fold pyridoxal phosphate-dependent enzyme [Anaerolineales bacterium]|nr:aminotransferase class III-fold pyridoxal phosphate-dependent enzyme [Anaerolineales bacterium]
MMSYLEQTPHFSEIEAAKFAQDIFGIYGSVTPLAGERDQNFCIHSNAGKDYVLKIANASEEASFLEAQAQAMQHLAENRVSCPQVVFAKTGRLIASVNAPSGVSHLVRLVTYLPGAPYGSIRRHSPEFFCRFGEYLGRLDRALTSFEHPATQRDFHWDLAKAPAVVTQYKSLVADEKMRILIEELANDFDTHTAPLLPGLRQSIIHNDANDYNVIMSVDSLSHNQQVVGVIDFGDMLYSYTVADLAIAVAYAILDKPDPLETAALLVRGYHQENPLTPDEIEALFGLVSMRLCASVCIAAYQIQQRPDDEYLLISQDAIRNTLPQWAQLHPRFAGAVFRHACGLTPVPQTPKIIGWLKNNTHQIAPVLEIDLQGNLCTPLDLGIGSPLIGADPTSITEASLTPRLFDQMKESKAEIGLGLYDEARLLYQHPAFDTGLKITAERRTIHIGLDLFAPAGTEIYAPLRGSLHAFADNATPYDYGPVIVLKHYTDDGMPFYTLYGHLSRESLDGLRVGQIFEAGQKLCALGTSEVNGGWPPHLHLQVITDLLELGSDFPGVCQASLRSIWLSFSPDPNLILGIPAESFPERRPDKASTLTLRKKIIGRNLSVGYQEPLKIERGWMQYLFDETGRRYVDAYNNVPHVGHCHPRVVAAGRQQMGILNTNTRYLHDYLLQYAERITATLPDPLSVCFFVNSGSEANELALRLARAYSGQRDMIVLESAYHGHTTSLIDISPYKHAGPGGGGAPPWVHTIPIPDTYRGEYKADDPQAAQKYARHVLDVIESLAQSGRAPAGFIAETCPSVAGQIFLPMGYLSQVYDYVRQAGGVCITDEVQTGYGRTGTHFYAFQAHNIVPDMVVLGKPIGNGHPIGVVVTRPEIAAAFDNGMEFFSTFGGNTVSCAIGKAVLDVVLDENLQAHALDVGNYLLNGLRQFKRRYPMVGDVRGSGLFLGVELIRHPDGLEPATQETAFIVNRMRQLGVLLGIDGPHHNVIKIRPPMPFSKSDADLLLTGLEEILWQDFKE